MKYILTVFSILSLYSLTAFGQVFSTSEASLFFNEKRVNAYKVTVDIESSEVKSAWNDFMSKENDFKINGYGWFSKKDLLSTDMEPHLIISNKNSKIYAQFSEQGNETSMMVFAEIEGQGFLNPANADDKLAYSNLQRLTNRFLAGFLPSEYKKEVSASTEKVEELEEEVVEVDDEIKSEKEEIEKLRNEIEESKENLIEFNNEKEELKEKLEESKDELQKDKVELEKVKTKTESLDPK